MSTIANALGALKGSADTNPPKLRPIPDAENFSAKTVYKGKGIVDRASGARGDQYVRLKVVLPDRADAELKSFIESWSARHPYAVRRGPGA